MKREIRDYLYDILHECEYLMKRSKEIDYADFLKNEDLKKAFVRSLEIVGEAAKKDTFTYEKEISLYPVERNSRNEK